MTEEKQEVPTLDPSVAMADPKMQEAIRALKLLIEKSKVRVGLMARRARNTLQRMQGQEPEPAGPVNYHGVKRWMRYHKRTTATFPEAPHIHPRHKRDAA